MAGGLAVSTQRGRLTVGHHRPVGPEHVANVGECEETTGVVNLKG
jgi:hypothetical protein